MTKLYLKDGSMWEGTSYGANTNVSGEVVFATGMMGYPESLTDPSFKGQILVLTYPLIGNYGVPDRSLWESDKVMISGLIVSEYIDTPSHFQSKKTLAAWLKDEKIPLLQIKDTRRLTQHIRDKGSMLGKIIFNNDIHYYNPNTENLVAQVSTPTIRYYPSVQKKAKTIVIIDCGTKNNILRSLSRRNVSVLVIPWNFDIFKFSNQDEIKSHLGRKEIDGVLISNGPGDPTYVTETTAIIQRALENKIPTLGICLGHQLLTLAAKGSTVKLRYGHRSQNQPCLLVGSPRCYITTQNHGFAVDEIPAGFKKWFVNANDQSNEGIIHETLPFMSVQFHPEATPGPFDTEWVFDYFLKKITS